MIPPEWGAFALLQIWQIVFCFLSKEMTNSAAQCWSNQPYNVQLSLHLSTDLVDTFKVQSFPNIFTSRFSKLDQWPPSEKTVVFRCWIRKSVWNHDHNSHKFCCVTYRWTWMEWKNINYYMVYVFLLDCGSLDPTLETYASQNCPQQHERGHFQCLVWDLNLTELRDVLESCSPGLDVLAISSVGPGCSLQN